MTAPRFTVRGETAKTWHECVRGTATLCGLTIAGRLRHSQGEVGCARCKAVREKQDAIRAAAERLNGPRPALTPGLAKVVDLAKWRKTRGAA